MHYAIALLALVASVSAQTATGTPPSCSTDYPQNFKVEIVDVHPPAASNLAKRQDSPKDLVATLKNGVLTDDEQRTGEIVINHQFQFDKVLQDPRFYSAGFSVCENKTLAIGPSAIFYSCGSGGFSNLYTASQGGQCVEVYLMVLVCGSVYAPSCPASSPSTSAATSMASIANSTSSTSATTPIASIASSTSSASAASVTPVPPTSSLAGPAVASVAPYPSGNSTTAAGTASASAPGRAATTSALAAPASGASAITVGSTFVVVAVALIAFAMF